MFESATTQGYRSNVLKPIMWIMFVLFAFTITCLYLKQEVFAYIFIGLGIIFLILSAYAYFYCLHKDPDLLRSEKFNIEKTALEKVAITGDSSTNKLKVQETEFVILGAQGKNDLLEERNEE
ncbi:hypothetical protein [Sphingobacterium faecium]|uniref:hypothetical protein n=1 Tax=Sphingobacterium faecium TaxID=34087 RepID=UPI00247B2D2E|nr:hypothetical protein [Sphingobacterium faecium]WGQ15563.1 hypothetical protein QG727_03945 [Sphingobacterium faecium]